MSFLENAKFAITLLKRREKFKLAGILLFQTLTGLLDLLGIISISLVSLYLINGKSSESLGSRLFPFLNLFDLSFVLKLLGMIAILSLLLKTTLSYFSIRMLSRELSSIQLRLSTELFTRSLKLTEQRFKELSAQNLGSNVVDGTEAITIGILSSTIVIFSESFLLLILFAPILIVSPLLGISLILIFGIAFYFLQNYLSDWNRQVGEQRFESQNDARNDIYLTGKLSKTIYAGERLGYFEGALKKHMKVVSKANGESFLIQQVPKYVLEITVVFIGVASTVLLLLMGSLGKSISILAMIIAVSTRLLPSLLRIQGSFIVNKTNSGGSSNLVELLKEIDLTTDFQKSSKETKPEIGKKAPGIRIENLDFCFQDEGVPIFKNLNLEFPPQSITVIKGDSGSGKTTLVDLILGLKSPTGGQITVNNIQNGNLIAGYMMQETTLLNGSVAQNISLCFEDFDLARVEKLMKQMGIDKFTNSDADFILGGYGQDLSGGQKQRIGLARALYQEPNLLVLDEPFSAIDQETCIELVGIVTELKNECTVIVISHDSDFDTSANFVIQMQDITSHLKGGN